MNKIFLSILAVLLYSTPVYAYLDPGTGSMLFSIIIALIATVIYSAKSFFFKVHYLVYKLLGKQVKITKSKKIIFYNEGEQYFSTYYPILKQLQERGIGFTYLYSEENDLIPHKLKNIDAYYIGKGNKAFYYLNTLEADLCIMTTPGLDVLQIKRSKGVKHYCHISHSAAGCAGYEVFGIDYFDSILLPNKYDKDFVRELEKKRNLPSKEIHVVGNPYLDYLSQRKKVIDLEDFEKEKTVVLLSPTWGKTGILTQYGSTFISYLLTNDIYLIIRPHPQSIRYEKEILNTLKREFSDNNNIEWDYQNDGLYSMSKADIMISDFSGIIFDFMFLFSKPVISIPTVISLKGKDYIDIDKNLWQIDFFEKYTTVVSEQDMDKISEIIVKSLQSNKSKDEEMINTYNPYFGKAALKSADIIENIFYSIDKGIK